MWKRLLTGLRIRERIEGYEVEGERNMDIDEAVGRENTESGDIGEGGFLPASGDGAKAQPTAGMSRHPGRVSTGEGRMAEGGFTSDASEGIGENEEADAHPPGTKDTRIAATAGLIGTPPSVDGLEEERGNAFLQSHQVYTPIEVIRNPLDRSRGRGTPERADARSDDGGMANDHQGVPEPGGFSPIIERVSEEAGEAAMSALGPRNVPAADKPEGALPVQRIRAGSSPPCPERLDERPRGHLQDSRDRGAEAPGDGPEGAVGSKAECREPAEGPESVGESGEDRGSLLSHDPEDEDADPDWLA